MSGSMPAYCCYVDGPCEESLDQVPPCSLLFLFPSKPQVIAGTLDAAVKRLKDKGSETWARSWRELPNAGAMVLCEICKAMRQAEAIVADVTTLNFNLLFEIGMGIGLGIPVIPVRDTTYDVDRKRFDEVGLFDTIGYLDFANSPTLADAVENRVPAAPLPPLQSEADREQPVFVMKDPVNPDGAIQMMSAIKKSRISFRTYDPLEKRRLTLVEARRSVARSTAVVAHLLSASRTSASLVPNAKAAFVGGLALAQGRVVGFLHEGDERQPIDYRDLVRAYETPKEVEHAMEETILRIIRSMQRSMPTEAPQHHDNIIERLDLGDIAAENEVARLGDYFVPTGQSLQARRGHARLVVGRKGTGKTAIFYDVRAAVIGSRKRLVVDLRPEGHQFTKLKELVLEKLGSGLREHTMVAFWDYILLAELARRILSADKAYAYRDPDRLRRYEAVGELYRTFEDFVSEDFSQRLLKVVDRVAERMSATKQVGRGPSFTEILFTEDIPALQKVIRDYLRDKDEVWLLVDNLDKGWPTHGTTEMDMLVVRSLLEATRKLQRLLAEEDLDFHCLVFLRTDIHEHLIRETPDKGKDTPIRLDTDDSEVFEEIVRRRVEASTALQGDFQSDVWPLIAESHVGTKDTFDFIVEHTLLRARDLLEFLQACQQVALNRGHSLIMAEDVLQAEKSYSEDLLMQTVFEIEDTYPGLGDALLRFHGTSVRLSPEEVRTLLDNPDGWPLPLDEVVELLLWFGFLGVTSDSLPEDKYAHSVRFNLRKLTFQSRQAGGGFVVHPAFRSALDVRD